MIKVKRNEVDFFLQPFGGKDRRSAKLFAEIKEYHEGKPFEIHGIYDDGKERLAKAFDEGMHKTGSLTRDDGLAAMQTSASMVCQDCSQCGIYAESEREDSYYLYYLLRAFEQKGQIEKEDMPRPFLAGCRKKEDYLAQLNRSLARAAMNLSWKNRFLESRDAVVSQFRELSLILGEFSHQIDQAADITEEYGYIMKKLFAGAMWRWKICSFWSMKRKREAYVTAAPPTDGA